MVPSLEYRLVTATGCMPVTHDKNYATIRGTQCLAPNVEVAQHFHILALAGFHNHQVLFASA